jgi:hypothetical protein
METVCGQSLLIASLEARPLCPYLTQLNEASAYIWTLLSRGHSVEEMTEKISRDYGLAAEEAGGILQDFLHELEENHYIQEERDSL